MDSSRSSERNTGAIRTTALGFIMRCCLLLVDAGFDELYVVHDNTRPVGFTNPKNASAPQQRHGHWRGARVAGQRGVRFLFWRPGWELSSISVAGDPEHQEQVRLHPDRRLSQ